MTDLPVSPFMHAANDYIAKGEITFGAVITAFKALEPEDQRLEFGKLCQRRHQVANRLIDLLFAVGATLPCERAATFNYLAQSWQKRGIDAGLAEQMCIMINEQFAR